MTEEIGVIPYIERNNGYRFIIIHSRHRKKKWIFPKGQPEEDKEPHEVAVNEAFEEAGIIGTIQGEPVRVRAKKKNRQIEYILFPFKVSKICRKWPEREVRSRKFVKKKEALCQLEEEPYAAALKIFLGNR